MKSILIVGLGNPGYENTYHNVGSDLLLKWRSSIIDNIKKINSNLYCYKINNNYIFILTCPSMMNVSGINIAKIYKYYKCEQCIVVVDDLDTKGGVVRNKFGVAANGHNGLRSIIKEMPNCKFQKIVIGIGRPEHIAVSDFVLSKRDEVYNNILYNEGFQQIKSIIDSLIL